MVPLWVPDTAVDSSVPVTIFDMAVTAIMRGDDVAVEVLLGSAEVRISLQLFL
jgi:hypothetical protein